MTAAIEKEGITYWICRNPDCGSEFYMHVTHCSHCGTEREEAQRLWPRGTE